MIAGVVQGGWVVVEHNEHAKRIWTMSQQRCGIHHTCTDGKTIPGHIVQFSPDQNSIMGTVLIGGESSIVNKMVLLNTITLRGCDRGDSGILAHGRAHLPHFSPGLGRILWKRPLSGSCHHSRHDEEKGEKHWQMHCEERMKTQRTNGER